MQDETVRVELPPELLDAPTGRGHHPLPHLVCVAGEAVGRSFVLAQDVVVLGRADVTIALGATEVSRRHAQIVRDPSAAFWLEDLGSANGTFLNGVRTTGRARLAAGDRIQIGETIFVFAQHDELAERMHRIQRLEAMGTMAGGIAHDFNNALAVIVAHLDEIEEALPPGEAREAMVAVRSATQSATSLAKRMLRLGRNDPMTIGAVPLHGLVDQTLTMARRRAVGRVTFAIDITRDLKVLGSHDELLQVFLNLVYNACDAMPHGGDLRIVAFPVELDTSQAIAHQLAGPGRYVQVRVIDAGTGMSAETAQRIFDPFFTTKARGQGTGLGLAMVHGIIRRHGGAIDVESIEGVGTTFVLHLARIDP